MYTVTYEHGIHQLTLHADGTYEQAFADNGKPFAPLNRDRWSVQQGDFWNGKLLVLQNPVMVDNGLGDRADMKKVDGLWQLRIRRSWSGRVRLLINEEAGLSFEKRT